MRTPPTNQIVGMEHGSSLLQRQFNLGNSLNGGIDAGQSTQTSLDPASVHCYTGNEAGQWVNVVTPGIADTEFAVPHNLGYIPSFIKHVNSDRACSVYQLPNTGTAWTSSNIYLKCNVASVALRFMIQ